LIAADGALGVIVSIISRQQGDTVSLNAANGGDIVLSADALALRGRREVALQAEAAISLSVPLGAVETVADSLTQSVQGSLVTVADSIIEQARNVHLSADETIMTHAQIHSVTADQDLFMDADRINMG
jgi:mannose/fructose/N-acetylgalactosamine-specific phosphotransferase system component IIC